MEPPGEASDERLMERYANGDGDAFRELFRRYESRAYAYFVRRTGCGQRASDLYQELFLRIHRARSAYDPSRPFAPWFFRIAQHLLVDERRRAARRPEVPLAEFERPGQGPDAERAFSDLERASVLVRGLSPVERHVLVAAKVDGRGYAEIAHEIGKSVVAVKKLASRAMRRLRSADPGVAWASHPSPIRSAKASVRAS